MAGRTTVLGNLSRRRFFHTLGAGLVAAHARIVWSPPLSDWLGMKLTVSMSPKYAYGFSGFTDSEIDKIAIARMMPSVIEQFHRDDALYQYLRRQL